MESWRARLLLQAQAVLVRVEGMKAENSQREHRGESMAYTEDDFEDKACEIDDVIKMF